jgi:transposase
MFRLAADVQVYLHRETIDFRIGINGLAILVEQAMHLDPFGRAVFASATGAATGSGCCFTTAQGSG